MKSVAIFVVALLVGQTGGLNRGGSAMRVRKREALANNTLDVCFSQKTYNWGTPKPLFDKYDAIYHFKVDPCTWPNNPLGCEIFYTAATDGLKHDWPGNAFVNPPYGREARPFTEKAIEQSKKWDTTNVLLLPARTDTKLFHELL